jgi:hypothetical protein
MRDEDRRGNSSSFSAQGRGHLIASERRLLERHRRITTGSRGTAAEVEQRQGPQPVDTAMKTPKRSTYGG